MDWSELFREILVALFSASVVLYLGAGRALRAPHREHLYERQIDIYLRLISSSTTVRDAGHRFLSELTSDDPNTDVGALLDNLGKVLGQDGSDLEAFLLLPSRVQEAATRLHSEVGTTYGIYRGGKKRSKSIDQERSQAIDDAWSNLVDIIRDYVGTDRLSDEVRRAMRPGLLERGRDQGA